MSNEDVAVALEGHGHEIGSLKHRMDAVEENQKTLNELASSVKVMAAELQNQGKTMETIQKDVTALGAKVDAVEAKPAKKWDEASKIVLTAALTAIVCFILRQIGIF
ncbi:hypothetical protein [uncultured Akkermansia sp.]|uniref:hypothetical protein n=1 Tax=uncultured Akkermansia sp. TaxID=512294 RepID=UPI002605F451|nr:hypothetical protein [uncultured Akkermansia sp.]